MSDRALIRLCRAIVGCGASLGAAGAIIAVDSGQLAFWWRSFAALGATVSWAFAAFAWLAIGSQPRNAAVWSMAASVGLAVFSAGLGLVAAIEGPDTRTILADGWHVAQGSPGVAWILVVAQGFSIPGLYIPLIYGLLLFPDGRLGSRGARVIAVVAAPLIAVAAVSYGWWFRPGNTTPEALLTNVVIAALVLCTAASTVDLALRFRASTGVTRLQYTWVAWGTSLTVLVFGGITLLPDAVLFNDLAIAAAMAAALCWVTAYGVALIRYRIYDIDLVVSRTLLYTSLVAVISLAYVGLVAGLGTTLGGPDVWRSVAATALIAIVFEPTRERLQRVVNRLVYGRRATPHEVLADLTARLTLAENPRDLLVRLTEGLRAGTGARRTAVWSPEAGRLVPIAVSDQGDGDPAAPLRAVSGTGELPGTTVTISFEDQELAYLTLEEPPGMTLQAADRRLAKDLAAAAALVLHRARLEAALNKAADQLTESRLRLTHAEDVELARLGSELEDGVRPLVRALRARLDAARELASSERAQRVSELLNTIALEAEAATGQIRALAHGIYPQVLSSQGLPAAARTLVETSGLDARLELDVGHRHGRAVESAVYFCLAEALTNAAKHARGPVTVQLSDRAGSLQFSITDAGPGFDPGDVVPGTGLHNMSDRIDMLGGVISITSRPGGSTSVRGAIPLPTAGALGSAPAS